MHAPLLLLAAAALTIAEAGEPSASTALLVLRSACAAHDPELFSARRLQRYAAATSRNVSRPIRVLGYRETCAEGWRTAVTRAALGALGTGGAVVCAGEPGAAVCGALAGAARALRRPQPAACTTPLAHAAAVSRVATALRWRRALVPLSSGEDCTVTMQAVAHALTSASLAVRDKTDDIVFRPHVVILCASGLPTAENLAAADAAHAVLFVRVDDRELSYDSDAVRKVESAEAFEISNITLDVRDSPYKPKRENSSAPISRSSDLSPDYPRINKKSFPSASAATFVNNLTASFYRERAARLGAASVPVNTIKKDVLRNDSTRGNNKVHVEKQIFVKNKTKVGPSQGDRPMPERARRRRNVKPDFTTFFRRLDEKFRKRLLLLSTRPVENHNSTMRSDANVYYDQIFDALDRETEAESTRTQTVRNELFLYERVLKDAKPVWRRVAVFEIQSFKSLDRFDDWSTSIKLSNSSGNFEMWIVERAAIEQGENVEGMDVMLPVLGSSVALVAVLACVVCVRYINARRRRRRRLGDAVLAPGDFTFPADERRRVGEGMETMLSCWLQQLHEFGGPELERPDLLKQPPHPAPSAPSSTCSVNRIVTDRRIRYKGDAVQLKYMPVAGALELKRKANDMLLVMQGIRHENLNPFIGCLCDARPALVWDHCGRGSLEDVLMADDIKLDWTFRLSLLTDLVKGMRYVHASPLRVHGRLTSRNCVVDSRWVLRITDYGLPSFYRAQGLPLSERSARELLWTAPELLREGRSGGRGSQPGDVFSFAIIMQEVIVRGEPYCMLSITPEEIVEKLSHPPPLIRPSVSMSAAPPEAVSVMRQCWSEAPDLRPDFSRLHDIFRHLHRGRKINIVDSMFEMLEKYSNNLEELIKDRTDQLDMEKKKTEQLLNRMLPRSVAERLLMGSRVEPEEFEEVSIYFSDIVGFTALAARSTPVQVVDLLNDLYTTFDAAIERYAVYKVETIGDAYMVVGGLPVRAHDHAESVATMALHLLHLAGRFRIRHLPATPLHLRIGLHTGPCCAGVVGLTMPRYCLFGDTVNTASRMESTGAAWRIQISAATAERLAAAGGYRLRSRGLTQIKGKGAMHTYWLLGKDGFDKSLPTPPPLESEEVLFELEGENESESSSEPPPELPPAPPPGACGAPPVVERQRSDPSAPTAAPDKYAWQRSGAVSADSSPPPRAPAPAASLDHSAPYSRYRCMIGGARALRRQWSLERGDALAAAAGARGFALASPTSPPLEPLALLMPAPRPPAARYRTRPDAAPPDPDALRPLS